MRAWEGGSGFLKTCSGDPPEVLPALRSRRPERKSEKERGEGKGRNKAKNVKDKKDDSVDALSFQQAAVLTVDMVTRNFSQQQGFKISL